MAKKRVAKKESARKTKKSRVLEYFDIQKKGKSKTVKKVGYEELDNSKPSEKQIGNENKMLWGIFAAIGILVLVLVGGYFFLNSISSFDYRGLDFERVQEGEITFYHTSFPAVIDEKDVNYNVWIRNDPRRLDKDVPFIGSLNLPGLFVLDVQGDLGCEGDGGIAIYNLQQVMDALGSSMITDPNATCDQLGRYGYLLVQEGNFTAIGQYGPACYLLQVKDCKILDVTERFLTESLVKEFGE